jgi:hypothetical protein
MGRCSQGQVFWEAPACHLRFQPSGRPNSPFSPLWKKGDGEMLTGAGFLGSPCVPSPVSAIRTPKLPLLPLVEEGGWGDAHRGRFFGKPLRAISGFSHQDAQTPPSPPCGRRGMGRCSQGQVFWEAPACHLRFQASGRPNSPFSPLWKKGDGEMLTGAGFLGSPCVPSPVSAIRTPKLPLLPLWEKGAGGDEGQKRTGMQKTASTCNRRASVSMSSWIVLKKWTAACTSPAPNQSSGVGGLPRPTRRLTAPDCAWLIRTKSDAPMTAPRAPGSVTV